MENEFKKKYKKFLIGAIVLMAIVLIVALVKKNSGQLVYVSNWDGMENRYAICAISGWDSIPRTYYGECWTVFTTDMTLDEIEQTNKRDFVKDIIYKTGSLTRDAKLFFNNNNYYVIFYEESWDIYYARCCCARIDNGGLHDIYFPMPVDIVISDGVAEIAREFGSNIVEEFYDFCAFDEACEFYERYTGDYITIDKENQTITVPGYEVTENILREDFITMDWKNRTYTYTDLKGNLVVFDGK